MQLHETMADRVMTRAEAQSRVVDGLFQQAQEIIVRKGHDYAADDNLFSNFEFTGYVLDIAVRRGIRGRDLSCLCLMMTKIARLLELLGGKEPNNESIEDTALDLANYAILLAAMRLTGGHRD